MFFWPRIAFSISPLSLGRIPQNEIKTHNVTVDCVLRDSPVVLISPVVPSSVGVLTLTETEYHPNNQKQNITQTINALCHRLLVKGVSNTGLSRKRRFVGDSWKNELAHRQKASHP